MNPNPGWLALGSSHDTAAPGLSALPIAHSTSDRQACFFIFPCKPQNPSFEPILLARRFLKLSSMAGTPLQLALGNKFRHLSCPALNVHPFTQAGASCNPSITPRSLPSPLRACSGVPQPPLLGRPWNTPRLSATTRPLRPSTGRRLGPAGGDAGQPRVCTPSAVASCFPRPDLLAFSSQPSRKVSK